MRAPKSTDAYSWIEAKNDLRKYLLAGTFDDALDTLVQDSGADATKAEANLKAVSQGDVIKARCANNTLAELDAALKNSDADIVAGATKTLRAGVTKLLNDTEIAKRLTDKKITASSTGREIWDALFLLRGDFGAEGKTDLSSKINQVIADDCQL